MFGVVLSRFGILSTVIHKPFARNPANPPFPQLGTTPATLLGIPPIGGGTED
jgi:hypothetical protein